jgi:hypothetical protein
MCKGRIVRAYERFLELPVPIVLVVLWLAGVGLVVLCALVLYLCWDFLRALVGHEGSWKFYAATRRSASISSGDDARCCPPLRP